MRSEKFQDLFDFAKKSKVKAGDGLDEGNFPFFTSSSVLKKRINKAQHFDEALIFGTGGSASVHFAGEPFATSTDCIVAITKEEGLNTKFVYYFLFGNIHLLERGFKGAGLQHISKKYIENLDIPILPLETQNKIVSVLDKASSLISIRRQTIKLYDDLLNSSFLQMFGHLINNPSSGTSDALQNCISEGDRINYGVVQPGDDFPNGVPIIRVGDFEDSYINSSALKKIDPKIHNKHKNSILNGGEVLIACVGATIGKVALVEDSFKGYNIVRATARINCGNKIKNTYLISLLLTDFYQHQLKILSRTVAQPTLNIKQIGELEIPIPPIADQNVFNTIYLSLIENKKKAKSTLTVLNELLNSLSQKVFNGQLNFNVDFELDALIKEIDLQNKQNDLSKIEGDIAYLQRLIDKLNDQEFKDKDLYDKAKHGVFQMLAAKEEDKKVVQEFDEGSKSLKLALK